VTLLTTPLELGGTWGESAPVDAAAVIERMRAACLEGVAPVSDHQPEKLRVDDRDQSTGGGPAVWLHSDNPTTGWVLVTIGTNDWCQLAYQFGHELGHVFSNSWEPDAKPLNPCQWVEEALVEAFSLRGLTFLADAWAREPPFPDDAAFADSIRSYRETILAPYRAAAEEQGMAAGFGAWFKARETHFTEHGTVNDAGAAVPTMLEMLEGDAAAISDMEALNRWPGRSGVPLPDYLDFWEKSCTELHSPGRLPVRLKELLAGA
jgi:hypothetical protein